MPLPTDQTHPIKQSDFRLPSRRFASMMVLLFMVMIVGVCIFLINLHYSATVDVAQRNLHNLLVVQTQFNQEIFREVDDIVSALTLDLDNDAVDFDHLLDHYEQFVDQNPILRTLLLLDSDGNIIFDSRDDNSALGTNVADREYFTVHLAQPRNFLHINRPLESRVDGEWAIPISSGHYRDGQLDYVLVVSISPQFWSESFAGFSALDDYTGILTNKDGVILTTFPYDSALIDTQVSSDYLEANTVDTLLPSPLDGNMSLVDSTMLVDYPLHLIIALSNTDALDGVDAVSAVIITIAVISILSGIGILMVYQAQYKALHLQTNNIFQINQDLKEEIQQRQLAEATLSLSEERYRQIAEIISDYAFATLVKDDGTLVHEWLTDSFYQMTGYNETYKNKPADPIPRTHPDDVEKVQADLNRTLEKGEDTVTEYRWRTASGDYIWTRVKRRAIWNEDRSRVVRVIGAVTNITAQKEAEIALRDGEERYRRVTELISDYAFSTIVNDDGTRTREWLTDSFYEMTGYGEEHKLRPADPIPRTHPDDLERVQADLKRTLETGEDTVTEYRWRIASGEYIWTRVKRRAIWNEDHTKVIKLIGAVTNITAQKEAEIALRASEERYRMVTEMVSDYAFSMVVYEDNTWYPDWITDKFYEITGYRHDEYAQFNQLPLIVHPDDLEIVENDVQRTLAGESTISEYRAFKKSGETFWLRVKRHPIWNVDHTRIVRILGVGTDITAQKEAEIALQYSEQRYRRVTELISDYAFSNIVYEDGTWEPEWLTGSFYHMTGYSADDETEFYLPSIALHPDDIARAEADIKKTVQGIPTTTEYRFRSKQEGYLWFRVTRTPVFDNAGRVVKFLGAGTNITAQKEAEIALRVSEERYREVTELMSDYAFSVSADIDGNESLDWVVGSYAEITGKTDVLTQEEDYIFTPEEEQQIARDKQLTLAGNITTSEFRIRHQKTGEIRWLRVVRQPIWNETEQRYVRYIGAASDITAQKEAEQALKASEQHYREVTELMSDYSFSVKFREGVATELEWLVGELQTITGLRPEQVVGNPFKLSQLAHPDDQEKLRSDLTRTLAGELTRTQYRLFHVHTRELVWLEITRQPIWNHDHTEIERVVVVANDITSYKEAETLLAESEERYRLVSELISDYVYSERLYADQSSEVEWVAGSLEAILGVSAEDVLQQGQIPNCIHPDDYRYVSEHILRSRMGNVIVMEYRVVHMVDESIRWVRESRRPIWDDETERVVRIISAVSDITNEKENADKLRENEKRYRTLADLISDYVFSLTVSPSGQVEVEWFAGRFEEITGVAFPESEVSKQQDMTRITHPDDIERTQLDVERTMHGESTISEYRIINAVEKDTRWIRVSRFPEIDKKTGRVVRILGATSDITEQKHIEFALRDSEERYRLLTELMTDYAFSVRIEADGRLYREWLIGNFEGIMGYQVVPEGYLDDPGMVSAYTENVEMVQGDVAETVKGQTTITEYAVVNRRDNQPRWIRVTRQPIWNHDHTRVIRYLGAVKDITAEKEAETIAQEADELRQDLEREKSLHELRSRFVSMVTHEFRNPLAAIQSSVSILDKYNERLTEESKQEKFVRIYGQIDRMTNLLEDLLQVGELENRALRFSPQRVDVVTVIADLYDEFRESIGRDHQLTLNHKLARVITFGDVKLLERAFSNIISNAIKYSPQGSEVITTVDLNGRDIVITIQDSGMGIPQRDFDKLFKAFFRASNVSTQPGTGLGLIIAKQSIELHKGTIDFKSIIGQGTTFTLTLPQTIGKQGDT